MEKCLNLHMKNYNLTNLGTELSARGWIFYVD